MNKKALVICGPTASGKTEFAHKLAGQYKGEIINADSMQVYKQLPIITASPARNLKKEINYHLYNFLDVDREFSVVKYANSAANIIKDINKKGSLPIIVGGSGMYISMLLYGYSKIPNIDEDVRSGVRLLREKIGEKEFFKQLSKQDPAIIKILNPSDTQRVIRAYEVFKQTGKSILDFQAKSNIQPLAKFNFKILFLLPKRQLLHSMCNFRLKEMFVNGAIEEVQAVFEEYNNIQTSSMKALGVSEIIAYICGKITKDKALELASAKTRQYAKRQITWFKNQIKEKETIEFASLEEYKNICNIYNTSLYM